MRPEQKTLHSIVAATIVGLLVPGLASAYVGPGAGISMLGALWGLIIGVVMAVGVILFWPIRMMIRKAKAKKAGAEETAPEDGGQTTADSQQKPQSYTPST